MGTLLVTDRTHIMKFLCSFAVIVVLAVACEGKATAQKKRDWSSWSYYNYGTDSYNWYGYGSYMSSWADSWGTSSWYSYGSMSSWAGYWDMSSWYRHFSWDSSCWNNMDKRFFSSSSFSWGCPFGSASSWWKDMSSGFWMNTSWWNNFSFESSWWNNYGSSWMYHVSSSWWRNYSWSSSCSYTWSWSSYSSI